MKSSFAIQGFAPKVGNPSSGRAFAPLAPGALAPSPTDRSTVGTSGTSGPSDGRPPKVSPGVWAEVFPLDRDEVRRRAALMFCRGVSADEAIHRADHDLAFEAATNPGTRVGERWRVLCNAYDGPDRAAVARRLADAAVAVFVTARSRGRDILADENPLHAAWRLRDWHAPKGQCLLTGTPVPPDAKNYHGDRIRADVVDHLRPVAKAFSTMVVEEARRKRSEDAASLAALPGPDPAVDPDDPSTWLLPAMDGATPLWEDAPVGTAPPVLERSSASLLDAWADPPPADAASTT